MATSLVLEVTQNTLAIGTFDTSDVITNTAGGLAGFGLLLLARALFTAKTAAIMTRILLAGTILSIIAIVILDASPYRYVTVPDVIIEQPGHSHTPRG